MRVMKKNIIVNTVRKIKLKVINNFDIKIILKIFKYSNISIYI